MSELYYAAMEADRAGAEDAYFTARPQLLRTAAEVALFRAGFERAYSKLWYRNNPTPALPSAPYAPVPGSWGTGEIGADCGCPPNNVCLSVACPRRVTITCAVGKTAKADK